MRWAMMSGRPIRVGRANPSSTTIWAARSTRSSSPSEKATRFLVARLAAVKIGFMRVPEAYTNACKRSR